MRFSQPSAVTVVLLLVLGITFAQQHTGTLKGTVTDQLGSLVVKATILLQDTRGAERKTSTNSGGVFEFRGLSEGKYDVKVLATGFELSEEKGVEVTPGRTTTLDLQLNIASVEQSVTVDQKGVSTDSDRNGDAIVLRGRDLEVLPSDPEALAAALRAMAGPNLGGENGGGPQVKVDGFSNGQMPPKEAIREIRVNQNPYSAENEYPGWGGIEIFTQPGSEKLHGGGSFSFNDESLNSRNPFAPVRAPFQQRSINANLTGPLVPKRASFAAYLSRYGTDSNAIVNATILDSAFKPVRFNQSFVTPLTSTYASGRVDLKLNKKHTMVGNYEYNENAQNLQGIGGFSLPSRSTTSKSVTHVLQFTETAVLSEKMINETRLQFSHSVFKQSGNSTLPALNVQDSFFGGGAQTGVASNRQSRAEVQNFLSWSTGNHFLKFGERFRYVKITSISPANFGGTYTFAGGTGPLLDASDLVVPGGGPVTISSLERYRRTLVFLASGKSALEIRNLGGGATQFSIAGGNPQVSVKQTDISLYFQDEWKVRPNFTLSPGLRYENQNNISSNWNFAPRIAFAWSPAGSRKKQPESKTSTPARTGSSATAAAKPVEKPGAPHQSKTVIRGGLGIFYNRIGEDLVLDTRRFDGFNQRQFVVTDPAVLDSFPATPLISTLDAFAQPQTRLLLGLHLKPSLVLRSSFTVEQQLPHGLRLALTYTHGHTLRNGRTVNINAPLAGTLDPAIPTSGVRPLGQAAGNILESQSNGRFVSDSLSVYLNGNTKKFGFGVSYSFGKSRSTDSGTSGSSFDPYDFSNEWGRAGFDARHFLFSSAGYQAGHGFTVNTFIVANSGRPFNIITGRDTNGDTFFSERPAFATDLSKPGVIVTPLGAFDPNPAPGQRIIPRNFGQGPAFLSVNFGAGKTFKFGPPIASKSPSPAGAGKVMTTTGNVAATPTNAAKKPEKPVVQRPYQLSFSVFISNAINHTNKGTPVGNMASPSFLKSTINSNIFFFGAGGTGGSGGNRQVTLRVRFSF